MSTFDDIESDLLARALLYGAASGDFDRHQVRILLELRERIRLPFSLERARRVVTRDRVPMGLTRSAGDMGGCDGLGA